MCGVWGWWKVCKGGKAGFSRLILDGIVVFSWDQRRSTKLGLYLSALRRGISDVNKERHSAGIS